MRADISILSLKVNSRNIAVEWGKGFNYLAIGNSITKHGINEYWWNEVGMAASSKGNDYFHLVANWLNAKFGANSENKVTNVAYNGAYWEVQANDRSEILEYWDGYLSEKLNLVTIQLSENVSDLTTFETDFREMVKYVSTKCPKAQIIVIDDFWDDKKSELKKKAISGLKVDFVDLSEIRGKKEYQAGMGTTVYDADGGEHTIEHKGVAAHPGDKGMKYYAEKIIEKLQV